MIGRNVRAARALSGLKQGELAELVNERRGMQWTSVTVSKIESGIRRLFADEVMPLADIFEVSPIFLLNGSDVAAKASNGYFSQTASDQQILIAG